MKFQIDNMTCGGCAQSVTKAIQSFTGRTLRVQVTTKSEASDESGEESEGDTENRVSMIKRVFRGEIVDYGRSK